MKKLLIALMLVMWAGGVEGATIYVKPMPGAETQYTCNKADGYGDSTCSDGTANSDIEAASAAAGAAGTIIISGGASGQTYKGTMLDSDNILSISAEKTIVNDSSTAGHTGQVTFSGTTTSAIMVITGAPVTVTGIRFLTEDAGLPSYTIYNSAIATFTNCIYAINAEQTNAVHSIGTNGNLTITNATVTGSAAHVFVSMFGSAVLSVSGGTFDHSASPTQKWLNGNGGTSISIAGVTITGPGAFDAGGIAITMDIDNVPTVSITNNTITGSGYTSIDVNVASTSATVTGNTIHNGYGYGIKVATVTSGNISNNDVHDIGGGGISTGVDISGTAISVSNNTIHDVLLRGISVSGTSNVVSGNTIYNIWNGAEYQSSGAGSGIYIGAVATTNNVTRNKVYDNFAGIWYSSTSGTGGDTITNNHVGRSWVNGITIARQATGSNPVQILNNSVYHSSRAESNPTYIGHGINMQVAAKSATIANNAVYVAVADGDCHGIYIDSNIDGFVSARMDNNVVGGATGANLGRLYAGGGYVNYTDFATWQTAVQADAKIFGYNGETGGGERHSMFTDPLFISSTNYRPKCDSTGCSPLIHAGDPTACALAGNDYVNSTRPAVCTIGAYEWADPDTLQYYPRAIISIGP